MGQFNKLAFWFLTVLFVILAGCQAKPTPQVENPNPTPTLFIEMQATPIVEQGVTASPTGPGGVSTLPADTQNAPPPIVHGNVIQVDINRDVRPISRLIYGISGGEIDYLKALRPALISWGGNPSTRYNWVLGNAWNAGKDWVYKNVNYGVPDGVSAADEFMAEAKALGIATRLAVPTLGWVAKDRSTCSFLKPDGNCGVANGSNCEYPWVIADPNRANVPSDQNSIAEWMKHLQGQGLVPTFVAMDNEPELWGYSHYDVHPTCTTYEEVLDKYLAYATAVRAVIPQAELVGPVTCCWYSYWNIAPGPADQKQDTPTDYIAWFLNSLRQHDEAIGQRTLDVLDVHFYPQSGVYNKKTDPETSAKRLRSTRALWDRSYTDESWIKQPIFLIPRLNELIDQYYPGTRLGISEWNFGADEDINGALAIADVLGILGREGVYYAAYWRFPPQDSPGYFAFKMYTNYDDQGSRFGGSSVWVSSGDTENVSSYAAYDAENGRLQIMLVNKNPSDPAEIQVQLNGFMSQPTGTIYRYGASQLIGIESTSITVGANGIPLTLPPDSITLVVLQAK